MTRPESRGTAQWARAEILSIVVRQESSNGRRSYGYWVKMQVLANVTLTDTHLPWVKITMSIDPQPNHTLSGEEHRFEGSALGMLQS